jgi:acyl-CoA dehydrogenase
VLAATRALAAARCTTWVRCCATGLERQKRQYLPKIASGELRLQSMGVAELTTGTDTTKIKTTAVKRGDRYVINGQKVWISRVQHSDLMILLARTTPLAEAKKKSEGLSIFIVDIRQATGNGMTMRPIATWSIMRLTSCSSTISRSPPRT